MSSLEEQFIRIYGQRQFESIAAFLREHGLLEKYIQVRENPLELCQFGFDYGLVEIVAFCYCHLKISLDIQRILDGHFKIINSTQTEFTELTPYNREISRQGIPDIHRNDAPDGMIIATLDEFTAGRRKCLNYLVRMIKFSKYKIVKSGRQFNYFYQVVDRYIESYRLLETY